MAGEQHIIMLRMQVLSCTNLLAKDRNGLSDPYVSSLALSVLDNSDPVFFFRLQVRRRFATGDETPEAPCPNAPST